MAPRSSWRVASRGAVSAVIVAWATATTIAPALADSDLPNIGIHRAQGVITIDGELADPGWRGATQVDLGYETSPGENSEPAVGTSAFISYDDTALYVAFDCRDPEPDRIRAPYSDRDRIGSFQQDLVKVLLDTWDDRRSAYELAVNPRGVQNDGIFTEAIYETDLGPDFHFDSAARINARGWTAELRIPFSSLRYAPGATPVWGVILIREYPREFAFDFESAPLPRGSPCLLCHMRKLSGMRDLPAGSRWTVAPYLTTVRVTDREREGQLDSPLHTRAVDTTLGADVKWSPSSAHTIDLAIRPDFSQVESDVPQVGVNNRFALFYPEKRPLFLEGTDLFTTPLQAVSTRTITDPSWGARATGKLDATSYTMLIARDDGGGSVILPGSDESALAPQDFESTVAIGRVRRDLGASFAGFLISDREVRGGGHNRVAGPDLQWRLDDANTITAQWLLSDTRLPARTNLTPEWDGSRLQSGAATVEWTRFTRRFVSDLSFEEIGQGFRDDNGFIPQVGYRRMGLIVGPYFYPGGSLPSIHPYLLAELTESRDAVRLGRVVAPGVNISGPRAMTLDARIHVADQVQSGGRLFELRFGELELDMSPTRRFDRLALRVRFGDDVDFVNRRRGEGGDVTTSATLRPFDRVELIFDGGRRWLDVPDPRGDSARLFTASVARLKTTFHLGPRAYLRLLAERSRTDREPTLYRDPVPRRERSALDSLLFSYKLNWQTLVSLGYESSRLTSPAGALEVEGKRVFLKLAYAWRR